MLQPLGRKGKEREGDGPGKEDLPKRLPLFGPLDIADLGAFLAESKERYDFWYHRRCPYHAKITEFHLLQTLGKGAFGKVILVQHKINSNFYAMKALRKRHITNMRQVSHALNEKRVLQCVDFPFGVRMEYFSRDNSYIYFVMPFISGGEIFTHLQKLGKFAEDLSKFFAAQVVLGFEYLHYLCLVYRDLKPENLLLDHMGYVKITDFGFTKPVLTRTYTFCGTPHYLAPEVITGHGYGHSVDWWSFGVLIYEFNAGFPPFDEKSQLKLFDTILANRYEMPSYFSAGLKGLISGLLQLDVTRRYGNLKGRANDIKDHEWFKTIDWMQILNRKIRSPFIPGNTDGGDLKNFPYRPTKQSVKLTVKTTSEYEEDFKDF